LNDDNERRQKIINEKPIWLEKYPDKEGYLQQKVLINIYQKFKFTVKNSGKAFCFSIESPTERYRKSIESLVSVLNKIIEKK
jgi:hypothetical protein